MPDDELPAGEAPIHAVAAEFDSGAALLAGVRAIAPARLGEIDAHSPVPIPGMGEALGLASSSMSLIAVGAALLGFAGMMGMCVYATAYDYVFNIGGRPPVSWPAFVVPSVSFSLMACALAVYVSMLFLNRLPRLNHPAFNIPDFTRVTQDRYFLTVAEGQGRPLDIAAVEAALDGLDDRPLRVTRVPR